MYYPEGMTREDIIRMAQEIWSAGGVYIGPSVDSLERFAALVAAAECEACATACEEFYSVDWIAQDCAAAIRARRQA